MRSFSRGEGKTPTFVQQFSGLKPEGITLAPEGSSAVIVFDTDGEPPRCTRWSLSKR